MHFCCKKWLYVLTCVHGTVLALCLGLEATHLLFECLQLLAAPSQLFALPLYRLAPREPCKLRRRCAHHATFSVCLDGIPQRGSHAVVESHTLQGRLQAACAAGRIRSRRAKQCGWARGGVWAEAEVQAEGCIPAAAAPYAASPSAAVSDPAAQPARYG